MNHTSGMLMNCKNESLKQGALSYGFILGWIFRAMQTQKKFRAVLEYDPETGRSEFGITTPEGDSLLEGEAALPVNLILPNKAKASEYCPDNTPNLE